MTSSSSSIKQPLPSLLDLVGNTPLIRLARVTPQNRRVEVWAKAEWFNPGGSIKDRPALNMIRDGERTGRLSPGKTILDATSGNTGIAYALIGAALGYKVKLCLPLNASEERKQLLRILGAELVLTDPRLGSDGAILKAREIYAAGPEQYFYPDQYNNPANWRAHYTTTGPEIVKQTEGALTHFVCGLGTTGTFTGAGRYLREHVPGVRLVAVQPSSAFHGLEGLKHLPTAIVPGIFDPSLPDEIMEVDTEEAYAVTRRLAREEGFVVGISSGAVLAAALRLANRLDRARIVVIFADGGERYLSSRFWEDFDAGPNI
ncbi:MAG: PLP-dependent cysteine synthase family protein [Chthonomonadales bacterium]